MLTSKLMDEIREDQYKVNIRKFYDFFMLKNEILNIKSIISKSISELRYQSNFERDQIVKSFDYIVSFINDYHEDFGRKQGKKKLTEYRDVMYFCAGGHFEELDQASFYIISGLYFHDMLGCYNFFVNKKT